jgi:hypothetical protein
MNNKYEVEIGLELVRKNNILIAVGTSKSVLRFILRSLSRLISAKYVQIDGEKDLSENLKEFIYNQSIDLEITANLPKDIAYEHGSGRPSPQVSTLEDETVLKWNSESLASLGKIGFNVIAAQKDENIYKKPEIAIESKYTAKYGRVLTLKQAIKKK